MTTWSQPAVAGAPLFAAWLAAMAVTRTKWFEKS